MSFDDTVIKFEERKFLDLVRTDAEFLAEFVDAHSKKPPGVLQRTEATLTEGATLPWFLPYVLATEFVDILPFSKETAAYLTKHPVVPGDEYITPQVENDDMAVSVSKGTIPLKADEGSQADEPAESNEQGSRRRRRPRKVQSETEQNAKNDSGDSVPILTNAIRRDKLSKEWKNITECFLMVIDFVSKATSPADVYFDSVVLPYILSTDASVKAKLTNLKPGSMDETLFALASYDDGALLRRVGFEMIAATIRAAGAKYGQRAVQNVINRYIPSTTGEVTLKGGYMRCFPTFPATLRLLLTNLKTGILDMKKA